MQPDIAALFNSDFDRREQLKLVASTLEHLRATYPKKWEMLGKGEQVREFKMVVAQLVRAADESADHRATVAYVTKAAVVDLEAIADSRNPRRALKGDLHGRGFHHEHATPVEVVLRTVTLRQNLHVPIFDILQSLCCRILVTNAERKRIDGKHAWTIPPTLEWTPRISAGAHTLLPSLLPLMRYHAVDPKLVFSLIPLSSFHKDLLDRIHQLMLAPTPTERMQWLEKCLREPKTTFELPDDIFQSTNQNRLPSAFTGSAR